MHALAVQTRPLPLGQSEFVQHAARAMHVVPVVELQTLKPAAHVTVLTQALLVQVPSPAPPLTKQSELKQH